jgi:iron complex transport system permease protein
VTRPVWVLAVLAVFIVLGTTAGVAFGPTNIGFQRLMTAFFSTGDQTAEIVVWSLRLPRVVAALIVGACLGLAGALLQISTRNPLGDPQLFGLGGGAAIVQALVLAGVVRTGPWGLVTLSVMGSLIGAAVIASFASREDVGPARLALIGVSVGALALAVATGFLTYAHVFTQQSLALLGGSMANRNWQDIFPALPFLALGVAVAVVVAGRLNVLVLGDRIASSLGANPSRTRLAATASAGILAGTAVGIAGVVGFVGLLVPHVTRSIIGNDARALVAISIPMGAVLVLVADQAARLVLMPSEVPVSLVTTALGTPLMIYVARRVL